MADFSPPLNTTEIAHLIEKFVVVEASLTHSNRPKPMYFRDNIHHFDYARSQIRHIELTAEDFEDQKTSWDKEFFQRNALMRGLPDAQPDDLVIISDADEIPKEKSLRVLRVCQGYSTLVTMEANYHMYGFFTKDPRQWKLGPKVSCEWRAICLESNQTLRRLLNPPALIPPLVDWTRETFSLPIPPFPNPFLFATTALASRWRRKQY